MEKVNSNLEIRTQKRTSSYILDKVERCPSEKEYCKLLSSLKSSMRKFFIFFLNKDPIFHWSWVLFCTSGYADCKTPADILQEGMAVPSLPQGRSKPKLIHIH